MAIRGQKTFVGGGNAGQKLRICSSSTSLVVTNVYCHHHRLLVNPGHSEGPGALAAVVPLFRTDLFLRLR